MFGRTLIIVLVVTFLGWTVLTRDIGSAGQAQVYRVQPGDTLWSIASARYAGDPREGDLEAAAPQPARRDDDQPGSEARLALRRPLGGAEY